MPDRHRPEGDHHPSHFNTRRDNLPPEPASISLARHRLADFLYDVPENVRMVAALLVSELTTNAILHAHTHFSLCADVTPFALRVEVADGTADRPVVKTPEPWEQGGRGMMLVSQLAEN